MSRFNIFLILSIFILLIAGQNGVPDIDTFASFFPTTTPTMTPTPTPIPVGNPVKFIVPKIKVDAPVIPVGTDSLGKMALPMEWDKVGWYYPGFKPGQHGNAVLAGHLDSTTGAGAIFYFLWQLTPGDQMTVIDSYGRTYNYSVIAQNEYPYDQVPISQIFGPSSDKLLNLITCTGVWNPVMHNYSHRRVVKAKMLE